MVDVLFVAPDLHRGGVGRCVSFIVDAAPGQGLNCALFLLRGMEGEYRVKNPQVTRGVARAESRLGLLLGMPLAIWRLAQAIRRMQPRVVCSHGLLCNLLVVVLRVLMRGRFRSVAFEHNSPRSHYSSTNLGRLKTWLLARCYPRHDRVVGVSKGVSNDLQAMMPQIRGRCVHIYNGIDLEAVHRQSRCPRDELLPPADAPILRVVALGRLAPAKGFDTLIEAARLLDDPRVQIDIVGQGPEESSLLALIERSRSRTPVRLLGHHDNPFPLIASGAVFVMTSVRESFGNVLIEALTLGLPIISTNCPYGPAEILNYGEFGVLVPVGDAPTLALALSEMLADETARAHYAVNGPKRAAQFSLDQHCRQVVALFQPLLQ